jgi:hypothetical protein
MGTSTHLMSAMIVLATRAREYEVASIRSSRRKRSSGGSPLVVQEARNLVTLDIRSLPSSRASIRAMDPGRNLFINLMGVVDREEWGKGQSTPHAVTKRERERLTGKERSHPVAPRRTTCAPSLLPTC